jgi:hypothetical protein
MSELINAVKLCSRIRYVGLSSPQMSEHRGRHRHAIPEIPAEFVANGPTISSVAISDNGLTLREQDVVTAHFVTP